MDASPAKLYPQHEGIFCQAQGSNSRHYVHPDRRDIAPEESL